MSAGVIVCQLMSKDMNSLKPIWSAAAKRYEMEFNAHESVISCVLSANASKPAALPSVISCSASA